MSYSISRWRSWLVPLVVQVWKWSQQYKQIRHGRKYSLLVYSCTRLEYIFEVLVLVLIKLMDQDPKSCHDMAHHSSDQFYEYEYMAHVLVLIVLTFYEYITTNLQVHLSNQQHRCKKARLEMFYKFHHHLVTIDSEYVPQPTENRSSHRKNNTHSYNIPYWLQDTVQTVRHMSFFPRTIPEWNSMPQEIVAAKSLDCFKPRLAAHL